MQSALEKEPEEGPPVPPGRGGPHACSGASCCVGEPFWVHQNAKNLLVVGAPPRTPLGELTALPTYNIVIVLVLCVCTHVYENALLFSLEC